MKINKIDMLAYTLLIGGFILSLGGNIYISSYIHQNTTLFQLIIYASGLMVLLGFFLYFRKKESREQHEIEAKRLELEEKETSLLEREKRLAEDNKKLNNRITDIQKKTKAAQESKAFPPDDSIQTSFEEITELTEKDQEVVKLIKQQSERFFDKIVNQKYHAVGVFESHLLWNDINELIKSVSQIYNPGSKQPLLETSIEQLLRAVNQISLNLIVLLDRFPVDIKKYNLNQTYKYIQTGVKGFGVYSKAEPYLDYIRPVYYLGQLVITGSNPAFLTGKLVAAELGKLATKQLGTHIGKEYALNLMHEAICIFANEFSVIYGEDYRHREVSWIYGTELTELVNQFPISRDTLRSSLSEISNLYLRSEYDRLYLYQCVTSCKTAHPERYHALHVLSRDQRIKLVEQLEQFFEHSVFGRTEDRVNKWKDGIEDRLGVKVKVSLAKSKTPKLELVTGLNSLASFILEIKEANHNEIPDQLRNTKLFKHLDEQDGKELLQQLRKQPPTKFSHPDMEPSSPLLADYIQDLMAIHIERFPYTHKGDYVLSDVISYFRQNQEKMADEMHRKCINFLKLKLLSNSPIREVKFPIARAILVNLDEGETPKYLYKNIYFEPELDAQNQSLLENRELWLLGTNRRIIILSIDPNPGSESAISILLWSGSHAQNDPVNPPRRIEHKIADDCMLTGGKFHVKELSSMEIQPSIVVPGAINRQYRKYFAPILEFCKIPSARVPPNEYI